MEEDLLIVETYLNNSDRISGVAFYKLREILMAWDNNEYIDRHVEIISEMKGV